MSRTSAHDLSFRWLLASGLAPLLTLTACAGGAPSPRVPPRRQPTVVPRQAEPAPPTQATFTTTILVGSDTSQDRISPALVILEEDEVDEVDEVSPVHVVLEEEDDEVVPVHVVLEEEREEPSAAMVAAADRAAVRASRVELDEEPASAAPRQKPLTRDELIGPAPPARAAAPSLEQAVLANARGLRRACWEPALRSGAVGPAVRVVLTLAVTSGGKVDSAKAQSAAATPSSFRQCVEQAARRWALPDVAPTTLRVPLAFVSS